MEDLINLAIIICILLICGLALSKYSEVKKDRQNSWYVIKLQRGKFYSEKQGGIK
jgi:hypothetical protein